MSRWFNPHDPVEVGLEWQGATRNVVEPVDYARELGHKFTLPATTPVEGVRWYSPGPVQASARDTLFYESWILATIYEVGREREYGEVLRAQAAPSGGSTTGQYVGIPLPATIPEALGSLDLRGIVLDPGEDIRIQFNIPGLLTLQPRILNVTFDVYASPPVVTGSAEIIFGFRNSSGSVFELASCVQQQRDGPRVYSWSTGELFQAAYDWIADIAEDRRRPWFIEDLVSLNTGSVEFYIRCDGPNQTNINWVTMSVEYCTENRVAVGGQERGARHAAFTHSVVAWQTGIDLVQPLTGTLGATLLQGREYALTMTRATDSYLAEQSLTQDNSPRFQSGAPRDIQALATGDGFPLDAVEYLRDTRGLIISDATSLDRGYALALEGPSSTDTLPYASNPYAFTGGVDIATCQQEITTTVTAMYRYVRLTARKIGQPANLLIEVGGATASLSSDVFDDLTHDANGWATVTLELDTPVVVQANANVVVTVTKGSGPNRWEVPSLFTQADVFAGDDLSISTYGGSTQRGTNAFGVFSGEVDYAITLLTPAPAVTGLSVERGTQELTPVDPVCPAPGRISALDYANICWDNIPIVSGSAFTYGYVEFPGSASNYIWAPDAAALDITGDLTLIARVAFDDWTSGTDQAIVAKFDVTGGADQRSYMLRLTATNLLQLVWSTAGTLASQLTANSTVFVGDPASGSVQWVASTIDVNNGAGGRTIRFWTSNDGVTWTQLGADVVQGGTTSIFNSTARLTIGASSQGLSDMFDGKISDVIVGNGIGVGGAPGGTTVFEMRNTDVPANTAPSFVATTGQTITVQRTGSPATFLSQGYVLSITGAPDQNNFCAWEVERQEGDDDWQPIARITQRGNRCVQDYEGVIGEMTNYRVRLCRLDGMCGDWAVVTGFVREGPTVEGDCQGLIFTSNEKPSATLAYPMSFENSPNEEFTFYESETVVLERLHMRDYMVAFRPLERGGVRFTRTMLVNAISIPPEILDEGFRELRDLAWDTLSYVAVLDTRGNKWYATIIVPSGEVRWNRQFYFASVDIVETTNRSSVIDVRSA